jgi:predicted nucleic acid-binding protein
MPLVVDASAVAGLAFTDEDPTYAESVIRTALREGAFVPAIFWFELRNVLITGERRGRIQPQQTAAYLARLSLVPLTIDDQLNEAPVLSLARMYSLSVYDAGYLELALRRRLPLATKDRALINAALRVGVVRWTP